MRITEVATNPSDAERAAALEFVDRIERHPTSAGNPQLSDHLRLDLQRPHDPAVPGPILVTVRSDEAVIAIAQLSLAHDASLLEVVADPELDDELTVRDDAIETAIDTHRRVTDTPLVWWLDDPTAHDHAVAERHSLMPWRELFEMRRPLPHPDRATIETRDFRPGTDDAAWLGVNNRAFSGHGEQGGWTLDTLRLRFDEPWFDPHGFRIHDDADGRMIGFCWTKIHRHDASTEPDIGEIYVIAVDPDAHGRGLGRQLTLSGLDSISDRGVELANLYVDAGNTAAVNLYERLGFGVHRRRVAFAPPDHR